MLTFTEDYGDFVILNHAQIINIIRYRGHCDTEHALDLAQDLYAALLRGKVLQTYKAEKGKFHSYILNKIDWLLRDAHSKNDPLRSSEELNNSQPNATGDDPEVQLRIREYIDYLRRVDGTNIINQIRQMVYGYAVNDSYGYSANCVRRQLLKNYLLMESGVSGYSGYAIS